MGPFNLASGDVPNRVLAGSHCSSMRLLNSSLENGGIQNRHTWKYNCMLELLDHQVVSFHTTGPLLYFCFIVSLDLKLF